MPVPIRTISEPSWEKSHSDSSWNDKESHNMFMLDLGALAGAAEAGCITRSSSKHFLAEATDEDAEFLLDLFNNGTIVSEAENTEDKKYAIPSGFSGDKLMRLKAASLVHGDSRIVGFTSKAVRVIKTLVLSEQNSYTQKSVKKPYSLIMAENRAKSASHSTLAFQRTASIAVTAQENREVRPEEMPGANDPYIKSNRFVRTEGGANKQYIVRMFRVNNGPYVILAWRGRNTDRHLTLEPKGAYRSRAEAEAQFDAVVRARTQRSDPYRRAQEISHPSLRGVNPNPSSEEPAASQESDVAPAAPASTRRRPTGTGGRPSVFDPYEDRARMPTEVPAASRDRTPSMMRLREEGDSVIIDLDDGTSRNFPTLTQAQQFAREIGSGEVFNRALSTHQPSRRSPPRATPVAPAAPVVQHAPKEKSAPTKEVEEVVALPTQEFIDKILSNPASQMDMNDFLSMNPEEFIEDE